MTPKPRPWEIGPPRPAAGFPWATHRTLWDVAHGHTPEPPPPVPARKRA